MGRPIHSVFGARIGFSGSADRMALLPVGPDPRRQPAAILANFERPNGPDRVAKNLVLHPVLISGIVNHSNFTQSLVVRNTTTSIYTEIWE